MRQNRQNSVILMSAASESGVEGIIFSDRVMSGDDIEALDKAKKLLQTQLITGRHKPRVWYYDPDGDGSFPCCFKWPMTGEQVHQLVKADVVKRLFGLAPIVKESFGNGLVFFNAIPINRAHVERKTSKLETDVLIYVGDHYFLNYRLIDRKHVLELFKILAFRKVIGTNDTCARNIICCKDKLWSIDDPFLRKTTPNMFKKPLPVAEAQWYRERFASCRGSIMFALDEWRKLITDREEDEWITADDKKFMLERISELCNDEWKF